LPSRSASGPQQRAQGINGKLRGMTRGRRQSSNRADYVLPADGSGFVHQLPFGQDGQGGGACHAGNTAFCPKTYVLDTAVTDFRRQLQNVAAGGVLHPHPGIGVGELPGIAGMFEVVQQLGRVHAAKSTPPAYRAEAHRGPPAPYNRKVLRVANHTPARVVSLQPSATVTLRDLGLLDRLVACTRYCREVCPEAADGSRVIVSDSWTAQTEQILAARPGLVLASVPYQLEAVAEILKAGVRFLGLAPRTLADIYTDIAAIAGVMGAAEKGEEVIRRMEARIAEVRGRAAEAVHVKVFCEEWGKPIIAAQPWVAELVQAAGGDFIGTPGRSTTADEIARAGPDVILAAWCGAGDRVPLEKIVDERQWQQLPAARNGRVFCISDELLNTPASSLLDGLNAVAWALHPELFARPPGIRQIGSGRGQQ